MIRKLTLALAAAAALGTAALAPTSASAWGWHHHHHHWGFWRGGFGPGYWGPTYAAGSDCYFVRRHVQFADGSWHWRRFTVCD